METIAVIVPVYRVEKSLPRCVESVLAQTYPAIAVVLIDDGSPDSCGVICDRYAARDDRVIACHTPNRGLSAARNYGIDRALELGVRYVCFVDSDDYVDERMVEELYAGMVAFGADAVQCGFVEHLTGARIRERHYGLRLHEGAEAVRAHMDGRINTCAWNKLYRMELFDGLRFPEGRNYEDIATTYRLLARCRLVASVEGCLYHHVKRSGSISQTRSLANLGDHWASSRERYEFCMGDGSGYGEHTGSGYSECAGSGCGERNGLEHGDRTESHARRSMATAASVVWRWAFGNGLADLRANRGLFEEVTAFTRRELPPLGEPGWPARVRFGAVLARVGGPVSLAVCYGVNRAAVAVADALGLR